jgi:molybdenum cofactor cytidylyltransferase
MGAVVRAIVLAGGASARMGRPKAALPLTDPADTFLSRLLRTLQRAGLPDIVVVTGAAEDVVREAAGRVSRPVRFVQNRNWRAGQLSSLHVGLDAPPTLLVEAALVALVDVPLVSVESIGRLVRQWRASRAPVVRPARGDEHGHPVIFDRAIFAELREADRGRGAKEVIARHEARIVNVPLDDPGAFVDIDTEEDYRQALTRLRAS